MQNVPGEDRAVLLLGYRKEMETMLQGNNPGLERRFPLSSAYIFEDYSDDDLLKILDLKLRDRGLTAKVSKPPARRFVTCLFQAFCAESKGDIRLADCGIQQNADANRT